MEIKISKKDLVEIINEDIDRLAARSYSEEGVSLYDGIRITSRDARVMGRMLEERDAKLRSFLAFCLGDKESEDVYTKEGEKNVLTDTNLVYAISVENCPKTLSSSSLKVLLRKYLVDGVLFDWYTKHNIQSSITAEDIEALQSRIVYTMRQGYTRKPMQPFGPKF